MIILIIHIGPAGQAPLNYNTFVDPDLQTGSSHYVNLTNYFNKMSFGAYKVIGQSVSVETPNVMSYYGSPPFMNRHLATKEVLQQKVDPLVNFADYDNWSSNANYTHSNQPDGTVDMVIMIWRTGSSTFHFGGSDNWSGEASLGYGSSYEVEGGNKTIKTGFGLNSGSGVTLHYWGERSPERNFKNTVHEIGHWLLGGSHPYTSSSSSQEHKVWGILTRGGDGICANTYESERLAWINPIEITGNILNAPFQDYVQDSSAYKYHPVNGATNEWFYFENHQKLSIYDNATSNPNDKGIFVIHQQGIYNGTNNIRVKTSNGQWDWENTGTSDCFGGQIVPKYKPVSVNRAGRNNRDRFGVGDNDWLFYLDGGNIGGWPSGGCSDWLNGAGLNNAFNTGYNDVFSNYSNPWARRWTNDTLNNFTMEITSQSGSNLYANFYLTDPLSGKPSLPQQIVSSLNSSNKISTTWPANLEPDVNAYKIYRELYYGTTTISEVHVQNLTSPSYADDLILPASLPNGVDLYVRYKVAAVDNQQKVSVKAVGNPVYLGRTFTGNYYPSSINQNYVFFGSVIINTATAIGNNSTLWIAPNTSVSFYNNHSLTALPGSRIVAKGTSSQPITFKAMTTVIPGTWNSVTAYSTNNIFRYCTFKHAVYGLYLYNSYPGQNIIENCSFFSNSQNGIRLYHSNAHVKSSNIYSNNSYGIYCYNSSNLILNGTRINNNGNTGLYSSSNNYISLYGSVIESNSGNGINSDYSDNIYVGSILGDWAGYNTIRFNTSTEVYVGYNNPNNFEIMISSIHDNSGLELYNFTTPGIYVYGSYWDINGCQYSGYVTFYGTQYSSLPVWDGQVSSTGMFGKISTTETADNREFIFDPDISKEEKLRRCKEIIGRNPATSEGKDALNWLYKLIREDYEEDALKEKENFFDYLNDLQGGNSNTETEKEVLKSMVMWQRLENNKEAAIQILNKMQKQYGNDEERWALTNLAFIYAHSGNVSEAKNLLKKLEKNYPDQAEIYEQLKIDTKDIENWITLGTFQDKSINKSIEINEIPEEVALIQNYPNPFNPITQIRYQIPQDGYVTLKVFDILGREVAELVNEEKIAGTYTVNFDASDLSSGIYFYAITAGTFNQVKKMLLVK